MARTTTTTTGGTTPTTTPEAPAPTTTPEAPAETVAAITDGPTMVRTLAALLSTTKAADRRDIIGDMGVMMAIAKLAADDNVASAWSDFVGGKVVADPMVGALATVSMLAAAFVEAVITAPDPDAAAAAGWDALATPEAAMATLAAADADRVRRVIGQASKKAGGGGTTGGQSHGRSIAAFRSGTKLTGQDGTIATITKAGVKVPGHTDPFATLTAAAKAVAGGSVDGWTWWTGKVDGTDAPASAVHDDHAPDFRSKRDGSHFVKGVLTP